MIDERLLISPEMARTEAEALLGEPVALRVERLDDRDRQLTADYYWFRRGPEVVRVTITDRDRALSLNDFSARIIAPVVSRLRGV